MSLDCGIEKNTRIKINQTQDSDRHACQAGCGAAVKRKRVRIKGNQGKVKILSAIGKNQAGRALLKPLPTKR